MLHTDMVIVVVRSWVKGVSPLDDTDKPPLSFPLPPSERIVTSDLSTGVSLFVTDQFLRVTVRPSNCYLRRRIAVSTGRIKTELIVHLLRLDDVEYRFPVVRPCGIIHYLIASWALLCVLCDGETTLNRPCLVRRCHVGRLQGSLKELGDVRSRWMRRRV